MESLRARRKVVGVDLNPIANRVKNTLFISKGKVLRLG